MSPIRGLGYLQERNLTMLDLPPFGVTTALGVTGHIVTPEVEALKTCVAYLYDVVNKQQIALQELERRVAKQEHLGGPYHRIVELSDDIWESILIHTMHWRDFVAISGVCRNALLAANSPKLRQRMVEAGLINHADQLLHKGQVACLRMSEPDDREAFWTSMQHYQAFVWGVLGVCEDRTHFQRHFKELETLLSLIKA